MTVIFRRRGGCDLVQSSIDWRKTVSSAPDVIGMTFLPIVSLVDDIPGKKHIARAIDLYLTCKICIWFPFQAVSLTSIYHLICALLNFNTSAVVTVINIIVAVSMCSCSSVWTEILLYG